MPSHKKPVLTWVGGSTTQENAFSLLSEERAYQDIRWADDQAPGGVHQHTPAEWLVYLQDYVTEAMHFTTRDFDQVANEKVMANIRKIGAMCVAAIEQNGAPRRRIDFKKKVISRK